MRGDGGLAGWKFAPLALLAGLTLSGCGMLDLGALRANLGAAREAESPLDGIEAFAKGDLEAALAMAKAGNDQAAMQCYPVLLEMLNEPDAPTLHAAGAVSAFQRARNARRAGDQSNTAEKINLACAPLAVSAAKGAGSLVKRIVGLVGSGGATGPLGFLGL